MKYPEHLSRGQGGDVSRFRAVGLGPKRANQYHAAGVSTAYDMVVLHAVGVDGDEAVAYHRDSSTAFDDILRLRAAGISGYKAADYHRAGVTAVDVMLTLHAAGIGGYEAFKYHDAGVTTPADMLTWQAAGINGHEASGYDKAVVGRVLAVGDNLNRLPTGTLKALRRASHLNEDLLAASDDDLRVAVVLAEDQYASAGKVSVPFIRESIGIL